ncbi:hypothetical protein GGF42_002936 [Coemansia sp. RSA 2424]|nr:hypothetical protein GGF42_002936 [Coemansia sp. RSA 2424]
MVRTVDATYHSINHTTNKVPGELIGRFVRLMYFSPQGFKLTLCEIINLLGSLPSITHLLSSSVELGHQFDDMTVDELGDYMLMSYYPLSKTFRRWTCHTLRSSTGEVEALCVVLLAIACPRFSCTTVELDCYNAYCERVEELVATEPYAGFVELIEPLPKKKVARAN